MNRILEQAIRRIERVWTKNLWPESLLAWWDAHLYTKRVGKDFDIRKPRTFSEKIQWYKIFYHNPILPQIVDKYEFKQYIAEKLGEGHTIPLLGIYNNPEDLKMAWDKLPNKFCLKSTIQSDGKYILFIDKSKYNIDALCEEIKNWFKTKNTHKNSLCWAYYGTTPRVLAEEYVENIKDQLFDYKFYCFQGKPECICASIEHFQDEHYPITYYSTNWEKLDVRSGQHRTDDIPRPAHLEEMIAYAKKLAKPFPFVRVDFFDTPDKLYLAELTFYPGGGFFKYTPSSYDDKLGKLFILPTQQ